MRDRRNRILTALVGCVLLLGAACERRSPTAPTLVGPAARPSPTEVGFRAQGIAIDGIYTMNVGDQVRVTAMVTMSDNSVQDMTAQATWSSEQPEVASVAAGLITARAPGTTVVSANYESISARLSITVRGAGEGGGGGGEGGGGGGGSAAVTRLDIEGTSTVAAGGTAPLAAIARYSDGSRGDVTSRAVWSVSPSSLAAVSPGQIRGISPGDVTVSATFGGHTATLPVRVTGGGGTAPTVTELLVSGGGNVPVGGTTQLTARARLSDGSEHTVTSLAQWQSANDAVATVANGLVHGVSAGTAIVTARFEGRSATATIQVTGGGGGTPPVVTGITINGTLQVPVGNTTALTATAAYSDGSQQTVTGAAAWTSGAGAVASVAGGVVTGVATGTAVITAQYQGHSAQVTVQVTSGGGGGPSPVVSIAITGSLSVPVGGTTQLTATATRQDGSQSNVTGTAAWMSTAPGVATVAGGLVSGVSAGPATIRASFEGITRDAVVTITAAEPTIIGITVSSTIRIGIGLTAQIQVLANRSDGSQIDVTAQAAFLSSNPLLVSVSASGVVTGLLPGLATITASFQGFTAQASVEVEVAAPTLVGISIQGVSSVRLLEEIELTVLAHFSDGSQQIVTAQASWSVGSGGLLGLLSPGRLRALLVGLTTVTVTYEGHTANKSIQIVLL